MAARERAMARTRSFCPYCHAIVPAGQRCPCRKSKRKPTPGDAARKQREPWRGNYGTAEYQRNRQTAIERTQGRCTDCDCKAAEHDGTKWRTAPYGGEVDHLVALEDGGNNEPSNLALRCKSCHAKRDAARRRDKARR